MSNAKTKAPAKPRTPKTKAEPPAATTLAPSNIVHIPFGLLRRAPENVRKTDIAADVESLADDIAAHGLLQSLIGYTLADHFVEHPAGFKGKTPVQVVGGGRRLQALQLLRDRDIIDDHWPVSVLIRDQAEAIELSLSENLARRDMNPADEFEAFAALMNTGAHSPEDLAKRFGYSGRYVKQRLRLADLVPEILDALRKGQLTLAAATMYARAADKAVQLKVFKAQSKRTWDAHKPDAIKYAIANDTKTTDWPIFKFIGAAAYERDGGGYEEPGLFDDAEPEESAPRSLTDADRVRRLASEHIHLQMMRRQKEMEQELEIEGQIAGFVIVPDITIPYHSHDIKAPDGYRWVGNDYDTARVGRMLKTIRNNRILVKLAVGIDANGALVHHSKGFLVPADQARAVDPPVTSPDWQPKSQAEIDAENRVSGIDLWAKRLAVGPFVGTPLEGRAFWPDNWQGRPERKRVGDVQGWSVPINIFVTDDQVAAQQGAAGPRYDKHLADKAEHEAEKERQRAEREAAEQAEEEARVAKLEQMIGEIRELAEEPAIILVQDRYAYAPEAYSRDENGGWSADDGDTGYVDLDDLLESAEIITGHWPTREAFEAASADTADQEATEDA